MLETPARIRVEDLGYGHAGYMDTCQRVAEMMEPLTIVVDPQDYWIRPGRIVVVLKNFHVDRRRTPILVGRLHLGVVQSQTHYIMRPFSTISDEDRKGGDPRWGGVAKVEVEGGPYTEVIHHLNAWPVKDTQEDMAHILSEGEQWLREAAQRRLDNARRLND